MKIIVLFGSLALIASLWNMDVNLCETVEFLPLLFINAAGAITIAWTWEMTNDGPHPAPRPYSVVPTDRC